MRTPKHSETGQKQLALSMERQLSRPESRLAAVILAMFCAVLPSLSWGQQGVILYRGVVPGDQFVIASEYTSVDSFTTVTSFVSPGGKSARIPTGSVVEIIRYPNLASTSITTDQEVGALEKMLADLSARAKRYPKASPVLQPWIQKLNGEIQMYRRNGKVKVGGSWVSKEEFEKGRGAGVIPELAIAGKTFKKVKLSGLKGTKVTVTHDGGVSQLEVADLSKQQVALLNATSFSIQIPNRAEEHRSDIADHKDSSGRSAGVAPQDELIRPLYRFRIPEGYKVRKIMTSTFQEKVMLTPSQQELTIPSKSDDSESSTRALSKLKAIFGSKEAQHDTPQSNGTLSEPKAYDDDPSKILEVKVCRKQCALRQELADLFAEDVLKFSAEDILSDKTVYWSHELPPRTYERDSFHCFAVIRQERENPKIRSIFLVKARFENFLEMSGEVKKADLVAIIQVILGSDGESSVVMRHGLFPPRGSFFETERLTNSFKRFGFRVDDSHILMTPINEVRRSLDLSGSTRGIEQSEKMFGGVVVEQYPSWLAELPRDNLPRVGEKLDWGGRGDRYTRLFEDASCTVLLSNSGFQQVTEGLALRLQGRDDGISVCRNLLAQYGDEKWRAENSTPNVRCWSSEKKELFCVQIYPEAKGFKVTNLILIGRAYSMRRLLEEELGLKEATGGEMTGDGEAIRDKRAVGDLYSTVIGEVKRADDKAIEIVKVQMAEKGKEDGLKFAMATGRAPTTLEFGAILAELKSMGNSAKSAEENKQLDAVIDVYSKSFENACKTWLKLNRPAF